MVKQISFPKYTKIRDTYTIEYLLGEGSFGSVYRVRHKYMGIQALKIFNLGIIGLKEEAELFNEAYILSKITHPNLVRIFEANSFHYKGDKYYYIAMEYVKGGTLSEYFREKGSIEINEALNLQKDICSGLSQLHKEEPPLIHRDIKLQNIMLEPGKRLTAKISDFGLIRHVDEKTMISEAAGTLFYLPPEAFWNYETTASDVFSAGIVFYMMLTGVPPFESNNSIDENENKSIVDNIIKSRKNKPKPPSFFNPKIDGELDEIVLKALETRIENRYQNAIEFLGVIKRYEHNKSIQLLKNIEKALELGKQYSKLDKAIELLEKTILQYPLNEQGHVKERYIKILENWKKGVIM